ncbi:exported protein of unknown function [Streptococcus thermophilus]|nr:exported protein of unknown function [Streptococcus thermophilus]CAD0126832.1 exported protein of unknown function [Streptococcus thermophilus]CAD0127359.1 exported protein of unknown function [Streptococcus thermophilus]CAD0134558.1 exported protein of unknown function [Streptococcus thermophilus]CAD0137728.1 exported protein of unknown function [Streptococcus thermophilus]
MKKILLFLIVILTILLPTTTIHAKEVRYDIASYKGHLIIDDDGNGLGPSPRKYYMCF